MASTKEGAVVLTTAKLDKRLLVMRHLPDRGTIELAWWCQDDVGSTEHSRTLEIAAEAVEVSALAKLCKQVLDEAWDTIGNRAVIAVEPLTDGAELVALRAGDAVQLSRRSERDDRILLSPAVLQLLVAEMLPAATRKLELLGFGMPQQQGLARPRLCLWKRRLAHSGPSGCYLTRARSAGLHMIDEDSQGERHLPLLRVADDDRDRGRTIAAASARDGPSTIVAVVSSSTAKAMPAPSMPARSAKSLPSMISGPLTATSSQWPGQRQRMQRWAVRSRGMPRQSMYPGAATATCRRSGTSRIATMATC
jgi:hypothetical protein